jgi:hypothetical protein
VSTEQQGARDLELTLYRARGEAEAVHEGGGNVRRLSWRLKAVMAGHSWP